VIEELGGDIYKLKRHKPFQMPCNLVPCENSQNLKNIPQICGLVATEATVLLKGMVSTKQLRSGMGAATSITEPL
jgi:hypothetical protein